ncbi:EC1118_1J11_1838p [Saccharomyces cerevisiae EC1118]|uniref:Putative uncharacterized protein YJL067W n=2 Tax=Saccharomyces cerevisiae TaxID=4932 RepID=YJG7_YEAST|nr:RecName: Full=Putative uncharacterized protein YJL067W [Saccharomyces cerevisiae S288C]AAT93276.1 YJL067W [Saccharomyces cerevisiae]WNV73335.1 hypothetical protein O6U65_1237 [Saccharomyces cerevisiae synthetic construct]CAY80712.2 EC1118_1J11_1838p [Saccharomyces cerevisiae EC1118]CAA84056.1 HRA116 [Saccharomyces cerevisiae]CAA89357.1 unnamed protein product [Saccharomyces cerevisiae]
MSKKRKRKYVLIVFVNTHHFMLHLGTGTLGGSGGSNVYRAIVKVDFFSFDGAGFCIIGILRGTNGLCPSNNFLGSICRSIFSIVAQMQVVPIQHEVFWSSSQRLYGSAPSLDSLFL